MRRKMNELLYNILTNEYFTFIKDPKNIVKIKEIRKLLSNIEKIKTGLTEYEVVKETRLYRLLHYKPIKKQTYKYPLLIIYALINKSYIFDLQQNKSWVSKLLDQGIDV